MQEPQRADEHDLMRRYGEEGQRLWRLARGIGVSHLEETDGDDLADLLNRREAQAEHAVDRLRAKFGKEAVVKGLAIEEE